MGLRRCLSPACRDAKCPGRLVRSREQARAWASVPGGRGPKAELSDNAVARVADVAQCLAPNAMMLLRERWEGPRHHQTPAALFIARYVELGGSEVVYLDRSETPSMQHWTDHHLMALDMRLTVEPLVRCVVAGIPLQRPHTW